MLLGLRNIVRCGGFAEERLENVGWIVGQTDVLVRLIDPLDNGCLTTRSPPSLQFPVPPHFNLSIPSSMQADAPVTIRTRKFITNRLLARRQFIVDVLHPNRANVSKTDLSDRLAQIYKTDKARVVTFGFRTAFGGGRSTGFGLIYDDEASQKKFEPKYRLIRVRVPPFCIIKFY